MLYGLDNSLFPDEHRLQRFPRPLFDTDGRPALSLPPVHCLRIPFTQATFISYIPSQYEAPTFCTFTIAFSARRDAHDMLRRAHLVFKPSLQTGSTKQSHPTSHTTKSSSLLLYATPSHRIATS